MSEILHHAMNLQPEPFEMIRSGRKTIELRLYDEKRQRIRPGDRITFTNSATGETLDTRVLVLHRFPDFATLYRSLPLLECGYTPENVDSAHPDDMARYYDPAEQQLFGVVGIRLTLL